jgi:transposase
MAKRATPIVLTEDEAGLLKGWLRKGTVEVRMAERARIILLCHEGWSTEEIAEKLDTRPARVSKWRQRFAKQRIDGLQDGERSGKPRRYDQKAEKRVLAQLDEPPPSGYSKWNGGLIAKALGDVSKDQVWRILRNHDISLQRRRSWCISTDPEFGPKAADIVGLYLDPPENALVLCVDEKPSIQALERAQGYLRLPSGQAVNGFSHCYKRRGTTTLFAALEVATGLVQVGHYCRRRRREFLHFMNTVVAENRGREIHVILDNLNTHKPKQDRWLQRHPNVHFHFIPTYSSWLNLVESWFSLLSRHALNGLSVNGPKQLREAIDRYVEAYNPEAAPFEWKKAVVHPKGLSHTYANLCK